MSIDLYALMAEAYRNRQQGQPPVTPSLPPAVPSPPPPVATPSYPSPIPAASYPSLPPAIPSYPELPPPVPADYPRPLSVITAPAAPAVTAPIATQPQAGPSTGIMDTTALREWMSNHPDEHRSVMAPYEIIGKYDDSGTRTGLTDGGVQTDGSDSYIIFTAGTGTISFS